MSLDLANTTIGRYRVVQLLGRGGIGEVYRARDSGAVSLPLAAALERNAYRITNFR